MHILQLVCELEGILIYYYHTIHYFYPFVLNFSSFVFLGAPLLGSTEAVRAALSGTTFGLPVSEVCHPPKFSFILL
jgi:hypothetical protein